MLRFAVDSFREGLSVVRLGAFDTSTPEGRGKERLRRLSLTTLASVVGRFVALLTPLVSVPLTLNYLGTERMGLWIAAISVIGMLAFAELGIGDGLITLVSRSDGEGRTEEAQRFVASGFFLMIGVSVFVLLVCLPAASFIPWHRFFNLTSSEAASEAGPAIQACVGCFALNLPLTVVQRVQAGYQEGFWTNLWVAGGKLAALMALIVAVRARVSLPGLVWVYCGVPVLFSALNGLQFFGCQRPWLRPRWTNVDARSIRRLLKRGFLFLLISAFSGLAMESDSLLVARVLGPEAVTQLYVPGRLFAVIGSVAMMFYLPMWGANAEALARGDTLWVRKSLQRLTVFGTLSLSVLAAGLTFGGVQLVNWWVGGSITVPMSLLCGLALWSVVSSVVGPGFMVLNAADILGPQVILYAVFVMLSLPAKVLLGHTLGIAGIAWVNAVLFTATVAVPLFFIVRRLLWSWQLSQLSTLCPVGASAQSA